MARTNPCVFIVGCARSGTTLLQRILDCHPDLAVANDSHFIFEPITAYRPLHALEVLAIGEDPPLTVEMIAALRSYRTFPRTGLDPAIVDRAAAGETSWFGLVGALYDELARGRGKRLAGEKSGRYANTIPHLHAAFPRARFIHIIRDGRDVALSAMQWVAKRGQRGPGRFSLYQRSPLATCALWWSDYVRNGRRDGAGLGANLYHEVRYEELTGQPEPTVRRLADFLALPYAPEMLRFHEGKTREDDELSSKKRWLPPTPGLRDWRAGMGRSDVALFEALAGDLLLELGYERATGGAAGISQGSEYRDLWRKEFDAAGSGTPT